MKKVLLGTTALVGAALLATPATAQLEVTLGGNVGFQYGFFSDDRNDAMDHDAQTESEIVVRAQGTADNGLTYGAYIELLASQSDTEASDEVNIFLSGDWGRIELGDQDGAAANMRFIAPTVGMGQIDGAWQDWIDNGLGPQLDLIDTSDDTKITYFTPRFAGFQVGVSYAPQGNDGETVGALNGPGAGNSVGPYKNGIEGGLNYVGDFGSTSVGLSATVLYELPVRKNGSVDNAFGWHLGAEVGFGGITFGGSYFQQDLLGPANNSETSGFNVGVTWESGPVGIGISGGWQDFDNAGGLDQQWAVSGGGVYTLAPGLTVGADVAYFDQDFTAAGADNNGFAGVVEVKAAF